MDAVTGSPAQPTRSAFRRGQACRHNRARAILLILAASASILPLAVSLAQSSSANYEIPRQSTDAGAGQASSASFNLYGTIGQPDAGAAMSSASYRLRGGFHRTPPLLDQLFANGFEAP